MDEMSSTCDRYDLSESRLKVFVRSAMQNKMMLCLLENDRDAEELENQMRVRSATIQRTLSEMGKEKLVVKTDLGYELTNIGRVQALILEKLVGTLNALDQHRDFWLNHYLLGIPPELQMKIGMLAQSEEITSDSSAPLRAHENFLVEMGRAREIRAVSPVIFPGDSETLAKATKKGTQVDLILTDEILEIVARDYTDLGKELLEQDNFRLYCTDAKVKEAFTVTDTILSLGLFRLNGNYDTGNDLICKGERARAWGLALFNHYLNISNPVYNI